MNLKLIKQKLKRIRSFHKQSAFLSVVGVMTLVAMLVVGLGLFNNSDRNIALASGNPEQLKHEIFFNETTRGGIRHYEQDQSGNIYVLYYLSLTKYDANMNEVWNKPLTISDGSFLDMSLSNGNVYISGQFNETASFAGGSISVDPFVSSGVYHAFAAAVNGSGGLIYLRAIDSDVLSNASNTAFTGSINATSSGQVYLCGRENIPFAYPQYYAAVVSLSPSGNFLWKKYVNPSNSYYGNSANECITDNSDNLVVFSYNPYTVKKVNTSGDIISSSATSNSIPYPEDIIKDQFQNYYVSYINTLQLFDSNLNLVRTIDPVPGTSLWYNDLRLDSEGYLHIVGTFSGSLTIDGATYTGDNDILYLKLDATDSVVEYYVTEGTKADKRTMNVVLANNGGRYILGTAFESWVLNGENVPAETFGLKLTPRNDRILDCRLYRTASGQIERVAPIIQPVYAQVGNDQFGLAKTSDGSIYSLDAPARSLYGDGASGLPNTQNSLYSSQLSFNKISPADAVNNPGVPGSIQKITVQGFAGRPMDIVSRSYNGNNLVYIYALKKKTGVSQLSVNSDIAGDVVGFVLSVDPATGAATMYADNLPAAGYAKISGDIAIDNTGKIYMDDVRSAYTPVNEYSAIARIIPPTINATFSTPGKNKFYDIATDENGNAYSLKGSQNPATSPEKTGLFIIDSAGIPTSDDFGASFYGDGGDLEVAAADTTHDASQIGSNYAYITVGSGMGNGPSLQRYNPDGTISKSNDVDPDGNFIASNTGYMDKLVVDMPNQIIYYKNGNRSNNNVDQTIGKIFCPVNESQIGLSYSGAGAPSSGTGTGIEPGLGGTDQNGNPVFSIDPGIYSWGENSDGQLGLGNYTNKSAPTIVNNTANYTYVTAGSYHSLAIDDVGDVYGWGYGGDGQLGNGTYNSTNTPTKINGLSNIVAVYGGPYNSFAIDQNGNLYGWGANWARQLGLNDNSDRLTPTLITGVSNVIDVAAGEYHTLALLANGDVYSWGSNYSGQLGQDNYTNYSTPTKISTLSNISSIDAGNEYSLAVSSTGVGYSWGENGDGQLGLGNWSDMKVPTEISTISNVADLSAGTYYSMALTESGQVYTFGWNGYGVLGVGNAVNIWDNSNAPVLTGLTGIKSILAGEYHAFAMNTSNDLYAWGANYSGQLGIGNTNDQDTPIIVPNYKTTLIGAGYEFTISIPTPPSVVEPPVVSTSSCGTENNSQSTGSAKTTVCLKINAGVATIYAGDKNDNDDICVTGDDGTTVESVSCSLNERSIDLTSATVLNVRQESNALVYDIVLDDLRGLAAAQYAVDVRMCNLQGDSNNDNNYSDVSYPLGFSEDGNGALYARSDADYVSTVSALKPLSTVQAFDGGQNSRVSKGSNTQVTNTTTPISLFYTTDTVNPGRYEIDGVELGFELPAYIKTARYRCDITYTLTI